MVWFHTNLSKPKKPYSMVEFFAGDANAGKSCKMGGLATAMLDIRYGGMSRKACRAFDMTTPSGLASLVLRASAGYALS